jgi:hypothetical protein
MGYQISRAVRLSRLRSTYLTRTFSGAPSSNTLQTFSFWFKRGQLSAQQMLVAGYDGSSTAPSFMSFESDDTFAIDLGGTAANLMKSTALFRDISKPLHIHVWLDTSQPTAGNRFGVTIDGVAVALSGTMVQNAGQFLRGNSNNKIGVQYTAATTFADGVISDFYAIDGAQVLASSFGQFDGTTGVWIPVTPSGLTYGTNGFHLDFSDNSNNTAATLGADRSGNGNNYTPTNLAITGVTGNDSVTDTPTNYGTDTGLGGEVRGGFPVFNWLDKPSSVALGDANLSANWASVTANQQARGSIALPTSGKWYWEVYLETNTNANGYMGLANDAKTASAAAVAPGFDVNSWSLRPADGAVSGGRPAKYTNGASGGNFGAASTLFGQATTYGFMWDAGTNSLYVRDATGWMNASNSSDASPTTAIYGSLGAGTYFPAVGFNSGGSQSSKFWFNFGQKPFAYTAPTGALCLATMNLATPAIVKPKSYFDVNLRTGTGAPIGISGFGFQPDFVWIKGRSGATGHALYDSQRGPHFSIDTSSSAVQATDTGGLDSFNPSGFTLNDGTLAKVNTVAATYVDWMWKRGALPGFDIVQYTGTTSAQNVGHAVGVTPEMIIIKRLTTLAEDFPVYHKNQNASPQAGSLFLSTNAGYAADSTIFNNTAPTSSLFSVGTSATSNVLSASFVAYLFASVAGFSKVGSYTGNGSADGPFVFCGFRPRFVMTKRIDTTGDWLISDSARDPFNVSSATLIPNQSLGETSAATMDFLSTGFKPRSSTLGNISTGSYVYIAFADIPFKYSAAPYYAPVVLPFMRRRPYLRR